MSSRKGVAVAKPKETRLSRSVFPEDSVFRSKLGIAAARSCQCEPNHINCLTAKEWLKCQLGVWQFSYSGRDIRDKKVHPATFPISLARKVIELFSHEGESVSYTHLTLPTKA
jgi:DNA modification methylase